MTETNTQDVTMKTKTLSQLVEEVAAMIKAIYFDAYKGELGIANFQAVRISSDGEVRRVEDVSWSVGIPEGNGEVPHELTAWEKDNCLNIADLDDDEHGWACYLVEQGLPEDTELVDPPVAGSASMGYAEREAERHARYEVKADRIKTQIRKWAKAGNYTLLGD